MDYISKLLVAKEGKILVTGAGGFIGGHLVATLREQGFRDIRAVDVKPVADWYQLFPDVDNRQLNLKEQPACYDACRDVDHVFNLAADMGGMWFIEKHKAECMLSVLISTNMLLAARDSGVQRFFYSSSACVYNADKQTDANVAPLKESDAYPALCEDGYGWEKLFSERMCRHFTEDFKLETRIARFHNVYGPQGTYDGQRAKAPAAICRKIAHAALTGEMDMEIWGDGEQTRSFMFVDDCVEGIFRLYDSNGCEALNLGSSRLVTINQLVDIVEKIGGVKVNRKYNLDAPKGVRGRNSDNTRLREVVGWEPSITLEDGLERLYRWVYNELAKPASKRRMTYAA